jgi:hypothetical protein
MKSVHPTKMKIAICQLITPNIDAFAKYSAASILEYCDRHDYAYFIQREKLIHDLHINWSKIRLLDLLQEKEYEYIVLIDADILLTNLDRPLDNFINVKNDIQITMVEDTHLLIKKRPNAGFIILRNTAKGKKIIKDWIVAAYNDPKLADKHPRNQRIYWKYVMPRNWMNQTLISRREISKYLYFLNNFFDIGRFAFHFDFTKPRIRATYMKKEYRRRNKSLAYLKKAVELLKQKNGLINNNC